MDALDLRDITLVCQDWGGVIGLQIVARHPERFARVVAANTGLPDGGGLPKEATGPMRELYASLPVVQASELGERFRAKEGPPGFMFWRKYCAESPEFSIGDVMQNAGGQASPELRAAYEASDGDLDAMSRSLRVSRRAIKLRMRELGLAQ